MKQVPKLCCVFLFLLSITGATQTPSSRDKDRPAYRHAYYLFLAGMPNGCEDCYVPLLVTAEPLEQAAKTTEKEACVLITTYKRDSIWHNDGIVLVAPRDIQAAPRIVHLRDRKYRYQEISSAEALKLFENPMGNIPISRPMLPNAGPLLLPNARSPLLTKVRSSDPTLEDLISSFRNLK